MIYLDLDDLLYIAELAIGAAPIVRDAGLLESAAARPRTELFGTPVYPTLALKAAALTLSIVDNHALVDGNKRLGWLACAVFLDINGTDPTTASNDDVYEVVMHVAAHPIEIDELARPAPAGHHRRERLIGPATPSRTASHAGTAHPHLWDAIRFS